MELSKDAKRKLAEQARKRYEVLVKARRELEELIADAEWAAKRLQRMHDAVAWHEADLWDEWVAAQSAAEKGETYGCHE